MRDTDTVQLKKFIEVRAYLSQAGVSVPRIIAVDKNAGLALLQDFGDNTYLNIIGNEKTCYAAAWRALIKIQRLPKKKLLPPYNATLLKTETALFKEWYCSRYLERRLTAAEEKVFIAAENFIVRSAVRQPQVVVHRDYHSRNLMLLKGNAIRAFWIFKTPSSARWFMTWRLCCATLIVNGRKLGSRMALCVLAKSARRRLAGAKKLRRLLEAIPHYQRSTRPQSARHFCPPGLARRQTRLLKKHAACPSSFA